MGCLPIRSPSIPPGTSAGIFLALLRPFGIDEDEAPAESHALSRPAFPAIDADALFRRLGLRAPYVLINPNASALAYERRWPLSHFQDLIRQIPAHDPALQVGLIGEATEQAYVQRLISPAEKTPERVLDLAGKTTLPELATLLSRAAMLITNR